MRKIYIIGAIALLFSACKPSVKVSAPVSPGTATFTNYLAIGNSLTAGYSSNSLTISGQYNSYPERLFEQFTTITGDKGAKGPFIQPLLHGDDGYPSSKLILAVVTDTCTGISSLAPITIPGFSQDAQDAVKYVSPANNGQINNIGVPGIRIADYPVAGYAGLNPYAARFYHNTAGSPMDELSYMVNNLYPTFFTMWLGANDVLGYATAGGQGHGADSAAPIIGNIYNTSDITPTYVFETLYDSTLRVATSTGASGALINIPDVTSVPFFTEIPANGLYLARQTQADSLNAFWHTSFPNISFKIGYNYFIIQDNAGNARQAVPGELILLSTPQMNFTCLGWGSYVAIPKQYVLTTDELQFIRAATTTFNGFIKQEATKYHLAYVDMYSYLGTVASGFAYNGINYNAQFVTGGAFSLDGVHLTPRGYALVANEIIKTINSYYHSTIPYTDVNKYDGIIFP
jgi:lysophospholipase L1-like esterase